MRKNETVETRIVWQRERAVLHAGRQVAVTLGALPRTPEIVPVELVKAANLSQLPRMTLQRWMLLVFSGLVLFGCERPGTRAQVSGTNSTPPPFASHSPFTPTNAQPKLQTVKLWLGSQEVMAELAVTLPQIMTGMMFRKEMAEHEGMLFVFSRPHRASFYMRNTLIPLTCAYIDSEGVILETHDMKPLDESSIEAASENVQYVLEMNKGWFERNKVSTGAVVRTEFGSFPETFMRRR